MKRRLVLAAVLLAVALPAAALTAALWHSHGGLIALIRGQLRAAPYALDAAISDKGGSGPAFRVRVTVDRSTPVATLAEEYLSFSIDASQVAGGKWWDPAATGREMGSGTVRAPVYDFDRPRLDSLVAALAPAYLRIGGSESDKLFYDLRPSSGTPRAPPAGYESVLSLEEWDALNAFALRHGLRVAFTLNAGPLSRDAAHRWNGANAAALMRYTTRKGYPVHVWELGNEVNNFWFVFGVKQQISTAQYHDDLAEARRLVAEAAPAARLGGQGSMFWPVVGEPLSLLFGFMPDYLERSGATIDQVSWHYYPQQSRRGPVATRRASPSRLLDPAALDEAGYWADRVRVWRDRYARGKPLWLGETGNAQFGGEPGLSDVYLADLWWLDELGLMARKGMQVVVRQTLSGMNYGLIDDATLVPRPDYWASLLWKRLMGPHVYAVTVAGANARRLRAYAQSGPDGSLTLLLINLDPATNATVELPELDGRAWSLYAVTAPDLFGGTVLLNGQALTLTAEGGVPVVAGTAREGAEHASVELHPLSYSFVTVGSR
jgi:heparanase 1